jgi:putative glutathione S-transferase
MGLFIQGKWTIQDVNPDTESGAFERLPTTIRHQISKNSEFQPESNRYHLIVSYACPWAHRTLITRKIKGLEPHIPLAVVHPTMGPYGWDFSDGEGVVSPSFGHFMRLGDLYLAHNPTFTGRVTVPVLWDSATQQIVNNESSEIIRIFNTKFNHITKNTVDLTPSHCKKKIDYWNQIIYASINNGVYRAGFARSQEAYNAAVTQLFHALDDIEAHLTNKLFLCEETFTEADIRLFVTLIRFDPVYVGHFKCNIRQIKDYPHIFEYMTRVRFFYDIEDTIDMTHIKTHYYTSHPTINPCGIIPMGPIDGSKLPCFRSQQGRRI